MSKFEVLAGLTTAPKNECRMLALSDVLHLSRSAVSRVVGRLEEQGLVTRFMCQNDRRGIFAALTDEGRKRYDAALPAYGQVLVETLGNA